VYLLLLFGEVLYLLTEFGELVLKFFLFEFLYLSDFSEFGIGNGQVGGVDLCMENGGRLRLLVLDLGEFISGDLLLSHIELSLDPLSWDRLLLSPEIL
jgi:hypothetical protein